MRKKSLETIKEEVLSLGLQPLFTEYKNAHEKILVKCEKHGEFYTTGHRVRLAIKRGSNCCRECCNEKIRFSTEYVKKFISNLGLIPLFDEYKNNSQKIIVECPKHGKFETTFDNIRANVKRGFNGCKKCTYIKISESHKISYEDKEKMRCVPEINKWKRDVRIKYKFTCQNCGQYSGKLNVHHILNFSSHPDLRTDINNGIVLCEKCHKEFHRIYGKKNNTLKQLTDFFNLRNEDFEKKQNKI